MTTRNEDLVIEIKDDKVCHLREYMDTAYIMSVV